ncbi:MAG: PASTA domain-containing protein [Desulfatibacillaceae bacterium]
MVKGLAKFGVYVLVFVLTMGAAAYFTLNVFMKSTDTVVVPNLQGRDVVYALEVLTRLGLNTKVAGSEYSNEVAKNHVLYQEPEPGSEIKADRDVRVILSSGPRSFKMPDLSGSTLRRARLLLQENGLAVGSLSYTHNPGVPADGVVAHWPRTGDTVPRGGSVDLLVSEGPGPVRFKMPSVTGIAADRAVLVAERSGLSVGEINYGKKTGEPDGVVLEQNPQWGYPVETGSSISLVVNRHAEGKDERPSFEQPRRFIYWQLDPGFLKRRIRLRASAPGGFEDVYNSFVRPGERLVFLLPQGGRTTYLLYKDGRQIDPTESPLDSRIKQWLRSAFPARERLVLPLPESGDAPPEN